MFIGTVLLPIGCLIAGWTSQAYIHWIAPDIVSLVLLRLYLLDGSNRVSRLLELGLFSVSSVFRPMLWMPLRFMPLPVLFIFCSIAPTYALCSALAAVACLRSLAGFGFPLFAPSMYKALGFGKGDTVLAVVAIVIGCPACVCTSVASITALTDWICRPWIFWHYGERIRMNSRHARAVVIWIYMHYVRLQSMVIHFIRYLTKCHHDIISLFGNDASILLITSKWLCMNNAH